MKEFKNKVAAITGSATGIGRAFAEEAAKRGMRLALIDINTEGLEETKAISRALVDAGADWIRRSSPSRPTSQSMKRSASASCASCRSTASST